MQGSPNPGRIPMSVHLLGQQGQQGQQTRQPTQEEMKEMQVMQATSQLSLAIYSHLATAHITTIDVHQDVDMEKLKQMATNSHMAAKAYFEGLGIIKTQEG